MRPAIPGRRERILGFGGPGAGKTRAWLTIAELYAITKTPGHFYVIDTDDTYYASVEEFPRVLEAGNVTAEVAFDFPGYREAANKFKQIITPDDWMVVDLFDKGWEEVQNFYSEQVFGGDKGDFFLAMRKEIQDSNKKGKNNGPGFEGWTDWPTIKALHSGWANDVIYKHRGHVYLAAGTKAVARATDDKDTIAAFGHIGAKPAGEKGLAAHGVNSVLMFTQTKQAEEWVIDTAKDRGGRQMLVRQPIENFARDYLIKVAGWQYA